AARPGDGDRVAAPGGAGDMNHRAVGGVAGTAQDHAAFVEAQPAGNVVFARRKQNDAADAVRVRGQSPDVIDRVLDGVLVVAGKGGQIGFHHLVRRQRHAAAFVTGVGIVDQVISQIVIVVDQRAAGTKMDPRCVYGVRRYAG